MADIRMRKRIVESSRGERGRGGVIKRPKQILYSLWDVVKNQYLHKCFAILATADRRMRKSRVERRARTRRAVVEVFQES